VLDGGPSIVTAGFSLDAIFLPKGLWDNCMEKYASDIPAGPKEDLRLHVQATRFVGAGILLGGPLGGTAPAAWFLNMVRPGGAWDYNDQNPDWDDFGNFHFGVLAGALLIPDEIAEIGAGIVNYFKGAWIEKFGTPLSGPPYGDDPDDQMWIQEGVRFYSKMMECMNNGD
jgi:hypothetical protein